MRFTDKRKITVPALLLFFLLVEWSWSPVVSKAGDKAAPLDTIRQRLVDDGFNAKKVEKLYNRPEVRFDPDGVSVFFTYSESKLNYDQFLNWRLIRKAKQYSKEYSAELAAAENMYGVDRYIITAIILVETKLGTYLGNRAVINTLSTMAALKDPATKEKLWAALDKNRRIARNRFDSKVNSKSEWAYRELKAFLQYAESEKIDPVSVRGSMAGAVGIAQFMPSNILRLGIDGDKDGSIDLFTHADAIASIGNYLKHHGWRKDQDRKAAYGVLLRYNYSKYYANTILAVADKLRG